MIVPVILSGGTGSRVAAQAGATNLIFDKLKEELLQSLRHFFPTAKVVIKGRRGVILELRAHLGKLKMIEIR